ncbi:hypothetical protein LCGC14_2542280 [marine sediment metagenome]|uniref:EGF-like domain-containing protein n=1 Tax=marine sediment metagenome TaxID=412755 RepID=A0A0F9BD79_9ZZZZ
MEHKCTCKAGYNGEVLLCLFHQSADALYEALKEARISLNVLQHGHSTAVIREIDEALAQADRRE